MHLFAHGSEQISVYPRSRYINGIIDGELKSDPCCLGKFEEISWIYWFKCVSPNRRRGESAFVTARYEDVSIIGAQLIEVYLDH